MKPNSLQQGTVVAAHGRHYFVELHKDEVIKCYTRGKRSGICVGDLVDISMQGIDQGAIERVHERRNLLYRSDEMRTKQFAANIDQLMIVVAAEPPFSEDLTGRALVAAWTANIAPVIILNKADLPSVVLARERLSTLAKLGVEIIELSALDKSAATDQLLPYLDNKITLLLGQSAMGKSTLLNALVPDANAHTQAHSQALGAGRHTTTSTRLYHVPNSTGRLIDSPGFQAFGLSHLTPPDIVHGFPEFQEPIEHCRFYNCSHRHEPGCGVVAALQDGSIHPERYALYQRLLSEFESKSRY
ncbi:ribosome small subunit-dependent GTPase A [Paenalcaligenes niemegkensis]|uniref:ribosome small subunit-dependent GTPase A n=1 Tax=Paenalcaligenes niemegkensis TaxID=2895469 RepID=UPI001EE7955D|nr:ribosome small subunit-dependent GTPase A [Paenalcaligenes niemegkensis]MCQ9616781.1 ribosome small subunit-dependent GTPase A [Paenalcaligenes niemegkensis]